MRACLEPVYQAGPGLWEAAARAAAQAPPRTQWPTTEHRHAQLGDDTVRTARQAGIVQRKPYAREPGLVKPSIPAAEQPKKCKG
ncbi:hypothetical protein [Streptosporangium roseum]|uniref:hypothetical protein n=1 Tax=Streptosporangium roseum TaxID=2001 RepID=UPI0033271C45